MTSSHIVAIDQGTSSSRAILFNDQGQVKSVYQKELQLIYPNEGWVEQNPDDIIKDTIWALNSIADEGGDVRASIAAIGITNQRETVIVWDRKTGRPVYNAIVWQDRRTSDYCASLRCDGLEDDVRNRTGLFLDPYFSASKIRWILENVDGARERADNGELLFGTVDCYVLWHLTGGQVHATDSTNVSRTMLYNIVEQEWDSYLFDLFDIPLSMAPNVLDNISNFGQLRIGSKLDGITIFGMAGDQQSALIGQGGLHKGMLKATYGTGCFALVNTGVHPVFSNHKMLTTIGTSVDGVCSYALEGSIFNAGTAVQFLRDNFSFFEQAKETDSMAMSVPDNGGVYFVPAFTGLGAPYWNPDARGIITGLKRDTRKEHIVRAALEAQAYQTQDLLDALVQDMGQDITTLRVDGGLVANDFMCQFLADQLGMKIEVPEVTECTAWGAACLAGVGAGVFETLEDAAQRWKSSKVYAPIKTRDEAGRLYDGWKMAVQKTFS